MGITDDFQPDYRRDVLDAVGRLDIDLDQLGREGDDVTYRLNTDEGTIFFGAGDLEKPNADPALEWWNAADNDGHMIYEGTSLDDLMDAIGRWAGIARAQPPVPDEGHDGPAILDGLRDSRAAHDRGDRGESLAIVDRLIEKHGAVPVQAIISGLRAGFLTLDPVED